MTEAIQKISREKLIRAAFLCFRVVYFYIFIL